jgi:predicted nucleic acid-binding protein
VILPDANVLVAFTWANHQDKVAAENFFRKYIKVATCPLTELALVRVWMQKGASGADADKALQDLFPNTVPGLFRTIFQRLPLPV